MEAPRSLLSRYLTTETSLNGGLGFRTLALGSKGKVASRAMELLTHEVISPVSLSQRGISLKEHWTLLARGPQSAQFSVHLPARLLASDFVA